MQGWIVVVSRTPLIVMRGGRGTVDSIDDKEGEVLMRLYLEAQQEERFYVEGHTKRAAFYAGVATTVLAAGIAGVFQADTREEYLSLVLVSALVTSVGWLGKASAFRWYRRFIEVLTKIAKVEQRLGLTGADYGGTDPGEGYWLGEPLVPPRHVASRNSYSSSAEFIDELGSKGDYTYTRAFFSCIQWLGGSYGAIVITLGLFSPWSASLNWPW